VQDAADLPMTDEADWHPIETAPHDGTPVLLFHPAWDMLTVGVHHEGCAVWQQPDGDLLRTPTHWTTLPEPPVLEPPG
jgi:hypothetical protein